MEELRSTEALDKEILEDARKKADKLLRGAEQASKAVELEWSNRLEADLAALEAKHGRRVAAKREETNARLPLDKRRLRAERSERLLLQSMDVCLRALDRQSVVDLLSRELRLRAGELPPATLTVRRRGLSEAEAKKILSSALGGVSWTLAPCASVEESSPFAALVIEGGRTTVRVGVREAGDELLREKRAELAAALLGQEALDD